jgi:hypothetical protein
MSDMNILEIIKGYKAQWLDEATIKSSLMTQGVSRIEVDTIYALSCIPEELPIHTSEEKSADEVLINKAVSFQAALQGSPVYLSGYPKKKQTSFHIGYHLVIVCILVGAGVGLYHDAFGAFSQQTPNHSSMVARTTGVSNQIEQATTNLEQEEGDQTTVPGFLAETPKEVTTFEIDTDMRIADITALSIQAEKYYDSNKDSYKNLCSNPISMALPGDGAPVVCVDGKSTYQMSVEIGDSKWYCVDSKGFSAETAKKQVRAYCVQ